MSLILGASFTKLTVLIAFGVIGVIIGTIGVIIGWSSDEDER